MTLILVSNTFPWSAAMKVGARPKSLCAVISKQEQNPYMVLQAPLLSPEALLLEPPPSSMQ